MSPAVAKASAVDASITLRGRLATGAVAGACAASLIVVFLYVLQFAGAIPSPAAVFVMAAAVLLGPAGFASPAAVPIGVGVVFVVAIAWALGYAFLARSQPQLLARPLVSGAAFGLIVYTFTQLALLAAGLRYQFTGALLVQELVAHLVLYGIPVALIVSSLTHSRKP